MQKKLETLPHSRGLGWLGKDRGKRESSIEKINKPDTHIPFRFYLKVKITTKSTAKHSHALCSPPMNRLVLQCSQPRATSGVASALRCDSWKIHGLLFLFLQID